MKNKYYYAYDKKVGRRVVHVLKDGYLISLVSGSKQKFKVLQGNYKEAKDYEIRHKKVMKKLSVISKNVRRIKRK